MTKLTHLEKIYFPQERITKGDLIAYYAQIAPYLLPYLKNRPLVMHRYPEGINQVSFFQKEAPANLPPSIKTIRVQHKDKTLDYITVQNKTSLLYVVNLGSLELHPFHSTSKHLDQPDYAVLDLDPENASFEQVVEVALVIHEFLDRLNVSNFCKTSGARGLHIYIPLKARYSFSVVKDFMYVLALHIHEKLPHLTSLERLPKNRQKKVYLDFLQNAPGQTLVAPYSVRAQPHATVSTPLDWKEVTRGLDRQTFTIKTLPQRLAQKGDLFASVLKKGVNIEKILQELSKCR